jgi:hypothetical protein
MASDITNEFRSGDTDNNLLRKILNRLLTLIGAVETVTPTIIIDPGQVEIGAVMLKDGVGATLGSVKTSDPLAADPALVTRNIPSGTQTVSVSNFPAVQTVQSLHDAENPLFFAARLGEVAGKVAKSFHVMARRVGFNSTSVLQDVAEFLGTTTNAMPELTGAENLEIVSSSANDTAGGDGTRSVRVTYIDTSNNLVTSADIALNGVTPVALAFKANMILWMESTVVGATTVAAGTILLRVVGGATHEQITAGGNRSLSSHFMVPAGYTGYLVDWGSSSIGSASQDVRLRATVRSGDRSLGTAYIFQSTDFLVAGSDGGEVLPWLVCPPLSRVKVSTLPSATAITNRIDSEFTILLIEN